MGFDVSERTSFSLSPLLVSGELIRFTALALQIKDLAGTDFSLLGILVIGIPSSHFFEAHPGFS